MDEYEAHIKANPRAERDAQILRDALACLAQLEAAGFASGEYDLAPSFGGRTPPVSRPLRLDGKMSYLR
jgi:hypothetical protein